MILALLVPAWAQLRVQLDDEQPGLETGPTHLESNPLPLQQSLSSQVGVGPRRLGCTSSDQCAITLVVLVLADGPARAEATRTSDAGLRVMSGVISLALRLSLLNTTVKRFADRLTDQAKVAGHRFDAQFRVISELESTEAFRVQIVQAHIDEMRPR